MRTGELNRVITISTLTESVTNGDVSSTWSTPADVRAKVVQIDGSRFLNDEELIDRVIYKIEIWDNAYSDNVRIVFEGKTLVPIRPLKRNPGKSFLKEVEIIAATKK